MGNFMRLARMLAGNGKLAVDCGISKVTKAGTKIKILNKGKGIFEKTVEKTNGETYTSLFGKKQGLISMKAVNQRGTWWLKPNVVESVNPATGTVYEANTILEAQINGLKGTYKTIEAAFRNKENVDNFLFRYIVGQDADITLKSLRSRMFCKHSFNNYIEWSA